VSVSEHQLQFDLDALVGLLGRLPARRDHSRRDGAARLLVALIRAGLAEGDLIAAAALALELDQPNNHNYQEDT
jgi:hypothetical protein